MTWRAAAGLLAGAVLLGGCAAPGGQAPPGAVADGAAASHTPETLELPQTSLDIVAVYPRPDGFTQGLELLEDGMLLHSTGRYGQSEIRIEQLGGEVVLSRELPEDHFGEGATVVGDTAYQLTWQSGVVHTWSLPDLEPGPRLSIETEGWGLCHDATRDHLWLSDGSSRLHALALPDLEALSTVEVTRDGAPVSQLNELECVDGHVWANVWHTDEVIELDPATGQVVQAHHLGELAGVVLPEGREDVLNGVAHDPSDGTWLVTGKNWDRIFRLRLG